MSCGYERARFEDVGKSVSYNNVAQTTFFIHCTVRIFDLSFLKDNSTATTDSSS